MRRLAVALLILAACDKKQDPPAPIASAAVSAPPPVASGPKAMLEKVEMEEIRIRENVTTAIKVAWLPPPGTSINDEAPFRVRWNRSDGLAEAPPDAKSTGSAVKDGYTMKVQPLPKTPNATLAGEMDLVVCDSVNHSVCLPVRRRIELGFIIVKDAPADVRVQVPLPSAK